MMTLEEPNLSVYTLIRRIPETRQFIHHRRTMSIISREIENATLLDHARNRIFAGFQVFSKFLPQLERYEQLAAHAESVYVFGVPDITPPPIDGVTYIGLKPYTQLAKEWFVVSYGTNYMSTLVTEEQSTLEHPDPHRIFHGSWTYDGEIVDTLSDWLSGAVGAPSFFIKTSQRNLNRQVEIMSHTMIRMADALTSETSGVIRQEVRQSLEAAGD